MLELLPIEKGIPIPDVNNMPKYRKPAKYAIGLDRLEVGDSVYYTHSDWPPSREMHDLKMRYGRLFAYRRYRSDAGKSIGIRVWRTA